MKRVLCVILALTMLIGLAACGVKTQPDPQPGVVATDDPTEPAVPEEEETVSEGTEETPISDEPEETEDAPDAENKEDGGLNVVSEEESEIEPASDPASVNEDFSEALLQYLMQNGYRDSNFMVSATSLRAALCLAIEGADGATKDELLKAAGFNSAEEMEAWYAARLATVDSFKDMVRATIMDKDSNQAVDSDFSIVNSIWANLDKGGEFDPGYVKRVEELFGAAAHARHADVITGDINGWVNEATHEMIPSIVDDVSECAAVLVNALYLRDAWLVPFSKSLTHTADFNGINGTAPVEMMEVTDHFMYYEDDDRQIVCLPMEGNMTFVVVLGNSESVLDYVHDMSNVKVHVQVPKLDMASTFGSDDLIGFLGSCGAEEAFDPNLADFGGMIGNAAEWYISDIIQKTKIKTDEEGLEAAAATAVMIKASSMIMEPETIYEFTADKPFSFYIFSDVFGEDPEMLFAGQYVDAN